jgi:OmpA-OmpF porin, OOP family
MRKVNRSILLLVITLIVSLWGAAFSGNVVAAEQVNQDAVSKKLSAQSRRHDPAQALQKRLKNQVARGVSLDGYAVALAQAWIDYGRESYARKDRRASGEAWVEAQAVIEAIERDGQDAKVNARLIPSSKKLRDDLWQKTITFRNDAEFRCATWQTARMEIALVAAGRADDDMGWRAARPFVQRAERFARDAEAKIKACAEPKPAAKVTEPEVKETTAAKKPAEDSKAAAQPSAKNIEAVPTQSLPDRVHFARESAELSDVSALVLEQVSYVMRANPAVVLDLVGYADELSTPDDNSKLAQARAQAVQDYLIETGVGRERLVTRIGESTEPAGKSPQERAKARRVEFVPTQSETIPMEYQDKDLATEGPQG